MSPEPTNPSPDFQRLINEGYTVSLENNCIVIRDVPYLDSSLSVKEDGILFDSYPHNPSDHTFHFSAVPYKADGEQLHVANPVTNWNGFNVSARLSLKKNINGKQVVYADHYDKVTYYIRVIGAHAQSKNSNVSAMKHRPIDMSQQADSPFNYADFNSSRAGINHIGKKLEKQKIAIVGMGGTGGYLLDFIAKTPVSEIHIYDGDAFYVHNAFRAPGAPSIALLNESHKKTDYFFNIYSKMHKHIVSHEYFLKADKIAEEFKGINFVFVCIDATDLKKEIIAKLIELNIPFIDCGMGVDEINGALNGTIRLTTVLPNKFDHVEGRIPQAVGGDNAYNSNIQIAELNSLNASLAVIKWKRILGFYHDHDTEHHSEYMINANALINAEKSNT